MALADDRVRRVLVLYGGTNLAAESSSTLIWNGTSWATAQRNSAPGPRFGAVAAYDDARATVVMYGGRPSGTPGAYDVWEWDGLTWTNRTSPNGPRVDAGANIPVSLAYDAHRGVCVLLGRGPSGATETWEFDGAAQSWTQTWIGEPDIWFNPTMAFDHTRGVIVVYGGGTMGFPSTLSTTTWLYGGREILPLKQDVRPGALLSWTLSLPSQPGAVFVCGLSRSSDVGIPLLPGPGNQAPILWPLRPDSVLMLSLQIPSLHGALDAAGRGRPQVGIPNDPSLIGATLAASAVTLSSSAAIRTITRDVRAFVVP